MKKKFNSKVKTRFKTPTISSIKKGNTEIVRRYTKALHLPVGHYITVRNNYEETEEGYYSTQEIFENRSGVLYREVTNRSRDCDGVYSRSKEEKLINGAWVDLTAVSAITQRRRWVISA